MVFSLAFATAIVHITAQDAKAPEAKTKEVPPIQADRPSFSNSASITPMHTTVVELGYRVSTGGGSRLADIGDGATVRLPVSNNFEYKIFLPSRLSPSGAGSTKEGFGDSGLGFKYLLSEGKGPRIPSTALSFTTTLPTGSADFKEKAMQPELRGLFSFELSEKTSLDLNAGISQPSEDGSHYTRFSLSASYQIEVKPTWTVFFEGFTNMPNSYRGKNGSFADLGVQKLICNNLVLDAFYGKGLNGQSDERFYGFGAGYRF